MKPDAFMWRCPVHGELSPPEQTCPGLTCGGEVLERVDVYFEDKVRPLVEALEYLAGYTDKGQAPRQAARDALASFNQEPTP